MPYFTDETKFTLPVTTVTKEDINEGWVEYARQDNYSLQRRELIKNEATGSTITQYRKVSL